MATATETTLGETTLSETTLGETVLAKMALRRRRRWQASMFTLIFVVPAMLGFVTKFIELIHTFQMDESNGTFAVTPIVNYLLASAGFFMMLLWATANGMFDDIEAPKEVMLERESQLDRP